MLTWVDDTLAIVMHEGDIRLHGKIFRDVGFSTIKELCLRRGFTFKNANDETHPPDQDILDFDAAHCRPI
jgi:hypothetical protein